MLEEKIKRKKSLRRRIKHFLQARTGRDKIISIIIAVIIGFIVSLLLISYFSREPAGSGAITRDFEQYAFLKLNPKNGN